MTNAPRSFTGRRRLRKTRAVVRWADRAARWLITLGGIGTIAAVSTVGLFLAWVAAPLFLPPRMEPGPAHALPAEPTVGRIGGLGVDERATVGWIFREDGSFSVTRLDTGERLQRVTPFEQPPCCWSFSIDNPQCAFGFADGTVRLASLSMESEFLSPADLSAELRALPAGRLATFREGVLSRTPEGQFRLQRFQVELQPPARVGTSPVVLLSQAARPTGPVFAALCEDGQLAVGSVRTQKNLLTGKETAKLSGGNVAMDLPPGTPLPRSLHISGLGDSVLALWDDGRLLRWDARELDRIQRAETLDLVPEPDRKLTVATFLLGRTTLLVGDSAGAVRAWFRVRRDHAGTTDGMRLVCAHELTPGKGPVTAIASSPRSRTIATAYGSGSLRLFQVTADQLLLETAVPRAVGSVDQLVLAPREDALVAASPEGLATWKLDVPHGGVTAASIVRPVWYEGYDGPEHAWQTSSATDEFEPKFGLWPLVFGTLKATFYSMLFAVPLALSAAIYTSEFLHPRVKARVKPLIEMMASLPSVVLGFLAALVIAPAVENYVSETLCMLVTVPLGLLLGGYLWQLLPQRLAMRAGRVRLPLMFVMLLAGLVAAMAVGRPVERWLFAGDIRAWLDGQVGTGLGGWLLLLLPASAVAVFLAGGRLVGPWLRRISAGWSRGRFALVDLGKFLVGVGAALGLALLLAWMLTFASLDPRGSMVDTYVQRNAMVVGFVMGFAVIPIIYTIAEDALSAVPEHLRAASLGAGATPWQTAIRIIVPTAMSGLFSAVMIGLGRAVGETMIVLMAAGNTPVLEMNLFSGFRTLSANIAVELPEAVQNSTHYRMLFLAALALFAMTFLVNTVAELVRLRFRKRAFRL